MSKSEYPTISVYPGAKAGYVGTVIAEILPYNGIKYYLDVFGGMANIILKKKPHPNEYYNDLNKKLATLMFVLSDEELSKELFRRMMNISQEYDQSSFDYAQFVSNHMLDPQSEFMQKYAYNHELGLVDKAAAVWRTLLMSFNGDMQRFKGIRTGLEGITLEEQLKLKTAIPERMKNVNILNEDAFELIRLMKDDNETLMVCDSPYVKAVMSAKSLYEKEITDKQQKYYVDLLYDSKAKILVCGYENDIYDEVLLNSANGYIWYKYAVAEVAKSMAISGLDVSKSRVTEYIWTNWPVS